MEKILKLKRDLVARSIVSKAPQKAKVQTELAKRIRHERRKGQARIMVGRGIWIVCDAPW